MGGISIITESLLLTSAVALINNHVLDKFNVTCVINTAAELPDSPVNKNVTDYYKIQVLDSSSSDLNCYFDRVSDIIQNVSFFQKKKWSLDTSMCVLLMNHEFFQINFLVFWQTLL